MVRRSRATATKSKNRSVISESDDEDSPEKLMEVDDMGNTDDADASQPKTKKRASRKAKENALNLRNWVETGRRKSQTEGSKLPVKSTKTNGQKESHTKRGDKRKKQGHDVDETEEISDAPDFGPVLVESDDDSTLEMDEDQEEPAVELALAPAPAKRKRADSDPNDLEDRLDSQSNSDSEDDVRDRGARVTALALQKHSASLGSHIDRGSPSTTIRSSSTRRALKLQKMDESPGANLEEYPDSDASEIQQTSPAPVTKRAKRALQTAALEKPILIEDKEGENRTRRPAVEKNAAASGRKPKLATSEPLFQLIWKWAGKELKRTVFFNNPFPDTGTYELLPLETYAAAAREVSKLGCYKKKDVLSQAREAYNAEWASSLTHRLSALRASLKSTTVSQVRAHFNFLSLDRRKQLLDNDEYWYKLTPEGGVVSTAPFMNPALQSILQEGLFKGRAGLYKIFPEEFEGEPGEKEMPPVLVALAATFLYMSLDANVNSSESIAWNYNSPTVAKVFDGHLDELDRIESKKSTAYHAILRKFFSNCVANTPGVSTRTSKKTKTDYENLPDSFSD